MSRRPPVPGDRHRRVLVLTFYYPPDLSAGSFRVAAMVEGLLKRLPADVCIDVLTTVPNRYHSFREEVPRRETQGRVRIQRMPLPSHRSGMPDQARAFLRFAWGAVNAARGADYDLVIATSSRLMTAALGAWIARRNGAALYLDIRDLFVDTIEDVLSWKAILLRPTLTALERWTVSAAARVNLVSPGFGPYFQARYPDTPLSYHTNAIDEEFLTLEPGEGNHRGSRRGDGPLRVVYAGNMGAGQGLHEIVPPLAGRLEGRAVFRLIGDGGQKPLLESALARAGVQNVELVPPMPRDALIAEYRAADVLFLHLNAYPAFEKVLPSKVFEYAALGKPIWAGVGGYAAEFLGAEVSNVAVFQPCDADAALAAFASLELADRPREAFIAKYRRRVIMEEFAAEVAPLLEARAAP